MKYKLGEKHPTENLYRIIALKDFGNVKQGAIGGWVEGEHNLAHDGDCWVLGNAQVLGNARVYGDAWVYGNAQVYGNYAPPKREWVGLTDAQVEEIAEYHGIDGLYETSRIDFYRAIEITLKEKNCG